MLLFSSCAGSIGEPGQEGVEDTDLGVDPGTAPRGGKGGSAGNAGGSGGGGAGGVAGVGGGNDSPAVPSDQVPPDLKAACQSSDKRGVAREGVRRLSRDELRTTLLTLLPVGTRVDTDITAFPDVAPADPPEDFVNFHSDGQVEHWLTVADKVGALAVTDSRYVRR